MADLKRFEDALLLHFMGSDAMIKALAKVMSHHMDNTNVGCQLQRMLQWKARGD